ncbi:hypothetical protein ACN47E_000772 [Coniothyrium glycines]
MNLRRTTMAHTTALFCSFFFRCVLASSILQVDTTSGTVQGGFDLATPGVIHFLNVPYAEPPVGPRRWLPAITAKRRLSVIDGTRFGPSCPQLTSNQATLYSVDAPEFGVFPNDYQSEDCLSANIWMPWSFSIFPKQDRLPVIAWIHGGSFQTGGASVPFYNPSRWIQRSRSHIFVAIQYRVNIFGSPSAAGLDDSEQNLGLLDQRLALEWLRTNVASFGGDPSRITLWGHSAGAVSVDSYNFAYPSDPIVSSLIISSGTMQSTPLYIPDHSNFTAVATHFSCASPNATLELSCMRAIPFNNITTHLSQRAQDPSQPPVAFVPMIDERTIFANYTARALAGNYSRLPALIGTTVDEGVAFILPFNATYGPNPLWADFYTLAVFLCPSVQTTMDRSHVGQGDSTTYRYLYAGNFSNISPRAWEGAYHGAELPLVFGSYALKKPKASQLEIDTSHKMQDAWLAFARDPQQGLDKLGWERYRTGTDGVGAGKAVLFGKDKAVGSIEEKVLESACAGRAPNGKPKPTG